MSEGFENAVGAAPGAHHEFMAVLGLLPPYSEDDVHKAYKARAREAHPDRGGSKEDFLRLQEAYNQAQEYVRFSEGRRQWLSNQVEPYLKQQEIVEEVERRHGAVDIEKVDWMQRSFGDFATLAERLRTIDMRNAEDADSFVEFLAGHHQHLRFLTSLDLSGSDLTDAGLRHMAGLRGLQRVNLSQTKVTAEGLAALLESVQPERVQIGGTGIGWWGRWNLARRFPMVDLAAD